MSEFWKSTPKYWCKFCSLYVKDTKFERNQHEATNRHQSNIQRSLRGIHKEQQAEQRKSQAAKDEIARLNGIVPTKASLAGASGNESETAPGNDKRVGAKPTFSRDEKRATLEDRKRQIDQLAKLGVAVPEHMRSDMAMAGDWQVLSQKIVGEDEKQPLNTGVRKRKMDEAELEAQAAGEIITKQKGWGKTFKSFPGKFGNKDDDIEALFQTTKAPIIKSESDVKEDPDAGDHVAINGVPGIKQESGAGSDVKQEGGETSLQNIPTEQEAAVAAAAAIKKEEDAPAPAVFFKKRKKIAR